ncbi:metalloregulator ArsR/SmtB family transcription factor [Arthrobacter sp. ISL-30]|uniref:helix-turn-helix transcriptional regulator n=1 Tax=Arthrobacter sp. ISL-30 TaxID=2819109 RepID=UPI001BEB4B90|nr:transcriptional regulator [Arthrobacter sp. ISL-30]MBT2512224.1 transcriptional regulator [Arthrobacter sp. ISL-30]
MPSNPALDPVSAVAALGDASRRAVYEWVLAAHREVGRDDVAGALGMVRGTAAFHLDRLAKEGLLVVSYRRLSGRSGPGSGRPTKMYARAEDEIAVSLPARQYDLAGDLLAAAIEDSIETGRPVADSLKRVAAAAGQEIQSNAEGQEPARSLEDVLKNYGYEPVVQDDGSIVLWNCPFHSLARKHTDTVCGLNVALLGSITEASSGDRQGRKAVLDPAPGRCCVRITPASGAAN